MVHTVTYMHLSHSLLIIIHMSYKAHTYIILLHVYCIYVYLMLLAHLQVNPRSASFPTHMAQPHGIVLSYVICMHVHVFTGRTQYRKKKTTL